MSSVIGMRGSIAERFERSTIPEPNSGCLLWLGSHDHHGYGQMRNGQTLFYVSHIALQLAGRPIPKGMWALHRCDNPYCVNADHLFIGTQKDNMADAINKGRFNMTGLELGRGWQRNQTHCSRGHPFSGDNLVMQGTNRQCRTCKNAASRAWKRKNRAAT